MTELVDARDVEPDAIGKIVDGEFEGWLLDGLGTIAQTQIVHDVVKHEREEPIGFNIYRDGKFVQHVNDE
jgi:hypothetical protein